MEYPIRRELKLGEIARLSRAVSKSDVDRMAELTGDFNPVHVDEEFAKRTRFGSCIAHGVIPFGLISAVLGTKLPGPGAIYLKQSLEFLLPVRVGDHITAEVEVVSWQEDTRIATLRTRCFNQLDQCVVRGEARLLLDQLSP